MQEVKYNDARSWSSRSSKRDHPRNRTVLQRTLPGRHPVAHYHAGPVDRYGWPARLGLPHNLGLHRLQLRAGASGTALETIGALVDPSATHGLGPKYFADAHSPGAVPPPAEERLLAAITKLP